jgi:putative oxidoreductase
MNKATLAARLLLGTIFFVFGLNFWLSFFPVPPPPEGHAANFMGAIYLSGFLAVVKVIEVLGALALFAKRTALGLLLLGPVLVNILLYDLFLARAPNPVVLLASALALFLLHGQRPRFLPLLRKD